MNLASGAYLGRIERIAAYSATKGALVSLTRSWATELSGTGVRVNAVLPRAATRMAAVRNDVSNFPDPADVAPLVSLLASAASAPLSGSVLYFDGRELRSMTNPRAEPLAGPPLAEPTDGWLLTALRSLQG